MSEMEPRDVIAGALEILANEDSRTKGTEDCQTLNSGSWSVREHSTRNATRLSRSMTTRKPFTPR